MLEKVDLQQRRGRDGKREKGEAERRGIFHLRLPKDNARLSYRAKIKGGDRNFRESERNDIIAVSSARSYRPCAQWRRIDGTCLIVTGSSPSIDRSSKDSICLARRTARR